MHAKFSVEKDEREDEKSVMKEDKGECERFVVGKYEGSKDFPLESQVNTDMEFAY